MPSAVKPASCARSEWPGSHRGAKLADNLHLLSRERSVSEPSPESIPHNSGVNSDPEATLDSAAAPVGAPAPDLGSIGPYRLIRKLGEGGMGQVWLAEQSAPVKRQVALKILKGGRYDSSSLLRFDLERQTLAIMDHPAIAKVFDAGSTTEGQPYLVMEYVPGLHITQYCDQKRLSPRDRLALFTKVCEGVQHAHQKAIIHRDLKPSNILVVEVDGKPMPRIIDFGIAKAISQKSQDETLVTRAGGLVGSPGYTSPEQADPAVRDVDTRTDVYSLGVVLYQLLTGGLPFDPEQWQSKPLHEVLRQLHEDDPPSPSTRISGDASSTTAAELRNTNPRQLASLLRGDLDWITLKALEKDRSRRYGTPSELAADIRRYLNNEAVLAVPPSAAYRARKFLRRYRGPLAAIGACVVVLMVAAAVSIRQSIRANREAAAAQAVNDFLQNDLLAQAGPRAQWGRGGETDPDLRVRIALDRAAAGITGKFERQPEVEASIRDTIGQTYMDLGLCLKAQKQVERARDLYRRALGAENSKTLRAGSRLAEAVYYQGRYAEAEALIGPVLKVQRRVSGAEHPDTLHSMYDLAIIHRDRGKYLQAEALLGQTLQASRRVFGPEHGHTLDCMDKLAEVYYREGKYTRAEALGGQGLEIPRRVLGPEYPETTVSRSAWANVYAAQGSFAKAESIYSQVLEIRRRVMGPEHGLTLGAMNNLAQVYALQGRFAQAEALDRA